MTTTEHRTFIDEISQVVAHHLGHPELGQAASLSPMHPGVDIQLTHGSAHDLRAWASTLLDRRWQVTDNRVGKAPGWYVSVTGKAGSVPVRVWTVLDADYADAIVAAVQRIAMGFDEARVCVDVDCPSCGWAERWFSLERGLFGCSKCDYMSTNRTS